jgi:hypothetical protein
VSVRNDLQPTPDCIDVSRFGERLSAAEEAHLQSCPRCEAERALWHAFAEPATTPEEDADVTWVAARLRDSRSGGAAHHGFPATRRFSTRALRPIIALAAAAVLVVMVGYVSWDREPSVGPLTGEQIYRSQAVQLMAPIGDIARPPTEFTWVAIPDAVVYDVRVLEVDGTVLWRTSSPVSRVALPRELIIQLTPGKTVLWDVTARNAAGAAIGSPGAQRFRVSVTSAQER